MIGSINCQPPDYLTNGWKRLKTSQFFWKLGSNPLTFEEAEATCTGRLISEEIFNLIQSSKNEPNHCRVLQFSKEGVIDKSLRKGL